MKQLVAWIPFKEGGPDLSSKILVYRDVYAGGYAGGIYIGFYEQLKNKRYIVIDDTETNDNNWRPVEEFSHWMPLPKEPSDDKNS